MRSLNLPSSKTQTLKTMAPSATSKLLTLHPHHLFLLMIITLPLCSFVRADEQLIEEECHNADVPTTCLQCLNSDPSSGRADRVGLVTKLIKCLDAHADNVAGKTTSLAKSTSKPDLRQALEICSKGLVESKQELSKATQQLGPGDYDNAGKSVRAALENPLQCEVILRNNKFDSSSNVFYEIKVYEELSDAAMKNIERL